VCETVAERIDGRVVVFEDSSHNPRLQEPERFNRFLREVWDSAP
jgi:pimeloyl-ACP methyl ester carboxylesterase